MKVLQVHDDAHAIGGESCKCMRSQIATAWAELTVWVAWCSAANTAPGYYPGNTMQRRWNMVESMAARVK